MTTKKITILVVEDEPSIATAITAHLKWRGLDTYQTRSGKDALNYLAKADKLPNGIWLDFDVLDMNGLEFMEEFVKHSEWKHIPVYIVSNTGDQEKIDKAMTLGVKKYIVKAEARLDDIVDEFVTATA